MKGIILITALLALLMGCAQGGGEATPTSEPGGLPNPASKYCVDQGYELEIRSDELGNQYGVCIFPDGSECEEWAFFRGECEYQK